MINKKSNNNSRSVRRRDNESMSYSAILGNPSDSKGIMSSNNFFIPTKMSVPNQYYNYPKKKKRYADECDDFDD